jgi:hypothetical protein
VTLQLSQIALESVQVDYSVTGGTATGGDDYVLAGGTLLFAPGVVTRSLEISLVDDAEPEPAETVVISLSNPQNAVLGTLTVVTLNIQDNDDGSEAPPYSVYLPVVTKP